MALTVPFTFAGAGLNTPTTQLDSDFSTITAYINARNPTVGAIASRPAAGNAGAVWVASDQNNQAYVDDGTAWQALGQSLGSPTIVRGLAGSVTAAGSTLALTADWALFNLRDIGTTLSDTLDLTVAGPAANGRDQAAAFNAVFVHVYWIRKPDGTIDLTASTTAPPTGPALPSGYTEWAYATTLRVGATNNQWQDSSKIRGRAVYYNAGRLALSAGSATAETTVSVSTLVPSLASDFGLNCRGSYDDPAAGGSNTYRIRHTSGADYFSVDLRVQVAADRDFETSYAELPNVSQQFFYLWNAATGTRSLSVDVLNYHLPNGG